MGLLWTTASGSHLTPEDFGWNVDHNAPNYFPEEMTSREVTVHPDDELTATQKMIDPSHPALHHFDRQEAEKDLPNLVAMNGETYINDGHHRLAGAQRAGSPIRARLWHEDEEY